MTATATTLIGQQTEPAEHLERPPRYLEDPPLACGWCGTTQNPPDRPRRREGGPFSTYVDLSLDMLACPHCDRAYPTCEACRPALAAAVARHRCGFRDA